METGLWLRMLRSSGSSCKRPGFHRAVYATHSAGWRPCLCQCLLRQGSGQAGLKAKLKDQQVHTCLVSAMHSYTTVCLPVRLSVCHIHVIGFISLTYSVIRGFWRQLNVGGTSSPSCTSSCASTCKCLLIFKVFVCICMHCVPQFSVSFHHGSQGLDSGIILVQKVLLPEESLAATAQVYVCVCARAWACACTHMPVCNFHTPMYCMLGTPYAIMLPFLTSPIISFFLFL